MQIEESNSSGRWTFTDLHDSTGTLDGGAPYGAVVLDASGNIFDTAYVGGTYDVGVVWEMTL